MLESFMTNRLLVGPNAAQVVLVFFAYSFLGYVMECVVLTLDKRQLVVNRGFVSHLPFCIIYGFGAMLGYALLCPYRGNWVLLFLVGALAATAFEYAVAQLQIKLFGDFWWDYNDKPLNYKGILCLESTLGWGVVATLIIRVVHRHVVALVATIPAQMADIMAVVLLMAYAADFAFSARAARRRQLMEQQNASRVFTDRV